MHQSSLVSLEGNGTLAMCFTGIYGQFGQETKMADIIKALKQPALFSAGTRYTVLKCTLTRART